MEAYRNCDATAAGVMKAVSTLFPNMHRYLGMIHFRPVPILKCGYLILPFYLTLLTSRNAVNLVLIFFFDSVTPQAILYLFFWTHCIRSSCECHSLLSFLR